LGLSAPYWAILDVDNYEVARWAAEFHQNYSGETILSRATGLKMVKNNRAH